MQNNWETFNCLIKQISKDIDYLSICMSPNYLRLVNDNNLKRIVIFKEENEFVTVKFDDDETSHKFPNNLASSLISTYLSS